MAETVGGPGGGARMVGEVRVQRVNDPAKLSLSMRTSTF